MTNKYLQKKYINNYSDIVSFSDDNEFKDLLLKLDKNKKILVTSHLIHKELTINQIEQFYFNLDNYINYIKRIIHINNLELKYIINLTIYNRYNKILYSDLYYYSNIDKYEKEFKKMFMYNYKKNIKYLSKYIDIKEKNFDELVSLINNNKKRIYSLFEIINSENISFYINIIKYIENIT